MRLIRFVLGLIIAGAVVVWALGAAHGFSRHYCLATFGKCSSTDVTFPGHVVIWLAPLVVAVVLFLYGRLPRRLSRHPKGR